MRDDIGERRRKHELRVLADAGVKTEDDAGIRTEDDAGIMSEDELAIESDKNDDMDEDAESSEDDLYEQVKQKRAAKLAAKAEIYTRLVYLFTVLEHYNQTMLLYLHWLESAEMLMRVELVAGACYLNR
jgi:hypothetical protein